MPSFHVKSHNFYLLKSFIESDCFRQSACCLGSTVTATTGFKQRSASRWAEYNISQPPTLDKSNWKHKASKPFNKSASYTWAYLYPSWTILSRKITFCPKTIVLSITTAAGYFWSASFSVFVRLQNASKQSDAFRPRAEALLNLLASINIQSFIDNKKFERFCSSAYQYLSNSEHTN